MNRWLCWTLTAAWAVSGAAQAQEAIRQNPGFQSRFIERNDDGSSRLEALGFTINFFGKLRSAAYVNNNGNLTFDEDLSTFTPFGLLNTDREIIAPFFADVDTRPAGSNVVTYGQDTVNGHRAFGANYVNVGYYSNHTDKLNSFQVVLIEREDQGPGDFDIEFNYERISWETGDASDGVDGFGGTPAAVGWSNGSETAFELPGSRVPGSFLDGGPYALVSQNITGRVFNTSSQSQLGRTGRLVFRARDGVISPGIVISGGLFPDGTMAVPYSQSLTVQGADPPYSWTLQPDVAPLPGLSLSPAGVLSGTPTAAGTYNFTLGVKAQTEDGEVTVYERGSLTIHPPELRITSACPLPDGRVGSPYLFNFAATGSSTSYTWRILDPETVPLGMGLSNSGLFAGTPQLPGTYMVYVQASATGNPDAKPAALKCRLNVNPARLQLTADNCFLPKATQGVPYSVQLDGQGGDGPYRFELIYSLPQGLALTQDGLLAGTPSYYGVYPFKIATNDSKGGRTVQDCALTVEPAPFFTSACPLPSGTTGVPYSTTLPGSYTWSVIGSLPAGLTLSPTGQISGTPMVGGPHYFRLLATDSGNKQSAEPCSLVIERGPLSVTGCPLPSARTGEPYQASVIGSGGAAPYMFTTQGTMPAGLSMSTSGVVSGTPTQAGEFPFSVVLRDANYATKVQACQLTVQTSKLHLTNACPLPAGRTGQAYSSQLEAAGGTAPYQYLIAGYLPDGLTLSSSGAITGMPQRIGSRKFTIYTVDASGAYVPQDCSLDVGSPVAPEVSLGNLPTTVAPAVTNLSIPVQLAGPAAAAVTGKVVMQVTPNTLSSNAVANSADPRLAFANGQTTATFTIPAGSSSTSLPVVSTGTVASTVTVSLADLRSSGSPLGQYPVAKTFQIAASAPTITSACYARPSTLEIEFRVNGISNTRELKRAVVTIPGVTITHYAIPPVPEFTITNRDEATIDLRNLSLAYYSSPVNVRTGGAFGLTFVLPVDIATDVVFNDVTLDVFNSAGGAGKRTIQACP